MDKKTSSKRKRGSIRELNDDDRKGSPANRTPEKRNIKKRKEAQQLVAEETEEIDRTVTNEAEIDGHSGAEITTVERVEDQTEKKLLESVSAVKSRIRGLKRLLAKKKASLPEDIIKAKEKEIEELEGSIGSIKEKRDKDDKEKKVDKKYRMVKFFERRKIKRKIENIQKRLKNLKEAEDGDEHQKSKLEDDLHDMNLNLLYIRHYPKGAKYISLFPKEKPSDEALATQKKIKEEIQKLQAEGKLPVVVDDEIDEQEPQEDSQVQASKPNQNKGEVPISQKPKQKAAKPQGKWRPEKPSDNPFVPSGGEKQKTKQTTATIREDDFFVT